MYEDNQGSIALAKNPEFHKRTKHIDIRYHFVREKVESGEVVLEYCPTQDMLADMMTKPIAAVQFENIRDRLGIQGAAANESRGSVEKTAAVKKTPRQAASSVGSKWKTKPRYAGGYRYVPVRAKSGNDVTG
uniref:Copia protein n=1 Tax=Peronospora matthiolae TaxID=2874970 RepID=A0AAV1V9K6_9STRA